ncbi:MAG: nickel-dependent lactate racemase [candidate division Zixibacteria bacterium]|nr:nickel-dependent lactate racemase [candidate division Zixibacteria bacterium]
MPMTHDIDIRYGDRAITAHFPNSCKVEVVGRRPSENPDESAILAEAVARPLAAPSLTDFLKGAESPLVVVNDGTRSTPTGRILRQLLPVLSTAPRWKIIVATGLHRAPNEPEMRHIFGDCLELVRDRVLIHNGYDNASLAAMGADPDSVLLNRAVGAADRLILINSVEPHFFAGFTGGRKSILPGLAGRDSIERSHAGAVTVNAAPMRVAGNPVREFIHTHTAFLDLSRVWSIQVVLDRADRMAAVFAGDLDKTFESACVAARKYYAVRLERHYDLVLSVVHPPLDINLYQAFKGWELSQIGVRDGGALIFTAPCREGVGSSFYQKLCDMYPNAIEWPALEHRPYTLGLHKFVRTARATSRYRLMAVTDMPVVEVTPYGFEAFSSVDTSIQVAIAHVGADSNVLVVEDSAVTALTYED